MKVLLSVLLMVALCVFYSPASADDYARYDNYKVYHVYINTSEQLKIFSKLNNNYPMVVMRQGNLGRLPYYVTVDPSQQDAFEKDLLKANMSFELMNEDLQNILDQRYKPNARTIGKVEMDWSDYHDLSTINSWIHKLARENSFIKKYVVGLSAELRPIYALHLSKKPGNKAIFVESNIHAIEWISSAVSTYFLNHLITTNSELLENYDWIFVPVLNPDGFHYSHTKNPLWRKNRRFNGYWNSSGLCYGVDLNRNYDNYWGQAGYNLDVPCDHWYAGKRPNTEPEVRAAVRFESSFPKDYIRMHLAVHSYGQLVLLPYGHTQEVVPENYQQMLEISAAFAKAAEARHGVNYLYGTSGQLLAPVSGASKDFWYDHGIKYSATIELRDRGLYGFFLPPKYIIPNAEEFTDGIYAMIAAAEKLGLFKKK